MMAAWMAWATLVTGMLGASAVAVERVLRASGRPGRIAWVGAVVGSVALAAWTLLRPAVAGSDGASMASGALGVVPADLLAGLRAVASSSPGLIERADPWLLGAWCVASAAFLLTLVVGHFRLQRRASQWPLARVGSGDALVSPDFGPALIGVRSPRVVVPRWALALGPERLAMAWAHEDEHRMAGDGRLFLAGAALLATMPWNVALWWQVRRLRAAAEVDCDARVLRRGVSRLAYGSLLLDVGARRLGLPFPVAALSKSPTLLERRLTMIVNGVRRGNPWGTAGAMLAAMLLVALACDAPAPTNVGRGDVAVREQATTKASAAAAERAETLLKRAESTSAEAAGVLLSGADTVEPDARIYGVIKIRPGTPLPDSVQPLVLIDGAPTNLSEIDPNTIESISVYKGAKAVERYGARGAHGAISIVTKKGADDRGT